MEKEHILVVDDEEGLLHLVKMRLKAMGFAVTGCTTGREAIAAAKNRPVRPRHYGPPVG